MPDGPVRVLLIEDDLQLADLVQQLLAEAGLRPAVSPFHVTHVQQLSCGLDHLDRASVDVVLLDLNLQDSQGLDTLSRIRSHRPEVPVVVLSGMDDEVLAARAVREGAQDYLVKGEMPLDLLARSIRYAIERRRAEAQLLSEQSARAEAEAALRIAQQAERQRRQRQRRELRSLERLSGPSAATVTAQAFGVNQLSKLLPEKFRELVERYSHLLDLAVEQRAYRVDHRLSDALRAFADEIGFLQAGPRDVVELHTIALKGRIASARAQKAQAYVDEGRVMILELMGYLVAYYRT